MTGLNVLGTVQLNWTAAETVKRWRAQVALAASFIAPLMLYAAMLASSLVRS